jgi:hypothetical protein
MKHSFVLYDPSVMSSDPTQQAMMDRYNGIFTPLEITAEAFKAAYDTPDIGPHIEKDYKGLSYLSWPFAYRYLKEHFPTLFVAFEEKTVGEVVFGGPGYYYLRPYLTDGMRRTVALIFPVMDRKHNAIKELDGRAISDNCQRAAVKCIATFTGLGLRLYAGEDIPKEDDQKGSPRLPLQQEAPKQTAAPAAEQAPADTSNAHLGEAWAIPFDGKQALVEFCEANPLGLADVRACQVAVKNALDTVGLTTGANVKTIADFGNVITTLVSSWTKDSGIKITKAAMTKELDSIRGNAVSVQGAIDAVKAFVEAKK